MQHLQSTVKQNMIKWGMTADANINKILVNSNNLSKDFLKFYFDLFLVVSYCILWDVYIF